MIVYPKDKALDLLVTFYERIPDFNSNHEAKKEAMFCANEVVKNVLDALHEGNGHIAHKCYWGEVEKELKKLNSEQNDERSVANGLNSSNAVD